MIEIPGTFFGGFVLGVFGGAFLGFVVAVVLGFIGVAIYRRGQP